MSELLIPRGGLDDYAFREAIYGGSVVRLSPSPASHRILTHVWETLHQVFGDNPRSAQFDQDPDEFFRCAGQLRRKIYLCDECRDAIAQLLIEIGSDPAAHVCDPMRIRVVTVGGHLNEAAAPVYFAHRDTWYSNPQAQITWWMPLHDVTDHETFEFLPDCFDQIVENDSEVFDYDRWTKRGTDLKIGWQDPDAGKRERYPRLLEPLCGQRRIGFSARAGEVIVFSGQHLHQTVPILEGATRFSIDFRTVHCDDYHSGLGPENVDNRSTGDALDGHIPVVGARQVRG